MLHTLTLLRISALRVVILKIKFNIKCNEVITCTWDGESHDNANSTWRLRFSQSQHALHALTFLCISALGVVMLKFKFHNKCNIVITRTWDGESHEL